MQRLYHVGDDRSLDLVDELELEKGEDAPMSMAAHSEVGHACTLFVHLTVLEQSRRLVCGINSSIEKLEKSQNENCRVYELKGKKYASFSASVSFN